MALKPVMQAFHPGDLLYIINIAQEEILYIKDTESPIDADIGLTKERLSKIASTTIEALEMWLGKRVIPLAEENEDVSSD